MHEHMHILRVHVLRMHEHILMMHILRIHVFLRKAIWLLKKMVPLLLILD